MSIYQVDIFSYLLEEFLVIYRDSSLTLLLLTEVKFKHLYNRNRVDQFFDSCL